MQLGSKKSPASQPGETAAPGRADGRFLASIVESASDVILSKTLKGIITSWNPAAEKLFGYTAAEAIGQSITVLMPPDRVQEEMEILERIGRGERIRHFETVRVRKDGTTVEVSVTISPIRDEEGRVVGASKILRDITEKKAAEARLLESETRLRVIIETQPECVKVISPEGRLLEMNQAGLAMLQAQTLAEVQKRMLLDFVAPDYRAAFAHLHQRVLEGENGKLEFEVIGLKGGHRWLETHAAPLRDASDRPVALLGITRDVTERKQAEEALRQSEESFRTLANSISQLAWIANADGFIFWYNQRWYDYTGTSPEQMEGWGWQSVHDPQVLPRVMEQWTAAIAAGQPFEMEFPLRGADGVFRRFLTRAIPLKDAAGQVMQWFGTNTDVDELKRAQDQVLWLNTELEHRVIDRTTQLAAANKELEAFSYSVSHDLRAPLRAVDGFARMVVEDYADKLDSEGQRMLGTIRSESQRMGQLIDDLLAFSRVGRHEMRFSPIDMTALARSTFEQIAALHPARKLHLDLQPLPAAQGELSMMRQVWVNLIGNAVKFTQNREVAEIEIGGSNEKGELHYFVRDHGAGFDMRFAGKLFGVFQRLHSEAEFEGTGVGLAFVQRIVHRHGGRVWAKGEVNQGATIHFVLPNKNL